MRCVSNFRVMASTSRANNEAAKWTQSEQDYLLKLMVEQVKVGNKSSSTFNKGGWNNIKKGLEEKTNRSFTMVQLRNKMNKMRFDYSAFKKLLDTTGFGWNSVTRTCTVEDESVWDVHIKANRDWSKFRRNGLPHWPELCIIFGDSYASGIGGFGNESDFRFEEESRGVDDEVDADVDVTPTTPLANTLPTSYYESQDPGTDRPRVNRRLDRTPTGYRKKSRTTGIERAIQTLAESVANKNTSTPSSTPMGLTPNTTDFSTSTCVRLLETMNDIPRELHIKACKRILVDREWRELFITLKDETKQLAFDVLD
ncbi:L10-interacting MYB domain-containing protein-like [Macadamia integrifolia]|uniref:L10-interacting MYB domain-containing protein-like n=1 Tax=Macadamia integrifolia TaxID=60698 RepID=UPI001C4ED3BE|nr:L10-interacting MYB domain-containing protein-like [Macadamia integrifolia]XP_042520086.1 L10-interacting MYB domain-containing protein-like [Macadamia integrifolia]XP_042520830.1 L10-interacting MYB domain-containing protein-like [Macadamia integrifolia]